MSTVITQQVEETEQQFLAWALLEFRNAESSPNQILGETASQWTERYCKGRTDAEFAALFNVSRERVVNCRNTWERFGKCSTWNTLTWSHHRQALKWEDATECLEWADGTGASIEQMNAWRNQKNGEPLAPEPVRPLTRPVLEPHEPIVQPSVDESEPPEEVSPSAVSDTASAGDSRTDSTEPNSESRSSPLETSRPHVTNNSGEVEWYTPAEVIAAAREVMGDIDLDPASCDTANDIVNAAEFYDKEQDGLSLEWHGRVFMNPPYAAGLVGVFTDKLLSHVRTESVSEAVVLVNNATETKWFQALAQASDAICFPKSRIRFWNPNRNESMTGLQGQAVVYFGPNTGRFRTVLSKQGVTVSR